MSETQRSSPVQRNSVQVLVREGARSTILSSPGRPPTPKPRPPRPARHDPRTRNERREKWMVKLTVASVIVAVAAIGAAVAIAIYF
jgi:hypothetical protein